MIPSMKCKVEKYSLRNENDEIKFKPDQAENIFDDNDIKSTDNELFTQPRKTRNKTH
jgi:hypothetical protein